VAGSEQQRRQVLAAWMDELVARHGSQSEVTRLLGVNPSTVSRWRSGTGSNDIRLENLVRIAELSEHSLGDMLMALFGVTPEELMPTVDTAEVATVLASEDGQRMRRLPASRYRMMLLLPEADAEAG
jgi:transcriptional regulator with XRE-family HTH domain